MARGLAFCGLLALLTSTAAAGARPASGGVAFQNATVAATGSAAGVAIRVTVSCTGAQHYSAHVWLASKQGSNQSFWDKTITGPVTNNKGTGTAQYRGAVPSIGFIVAGSNVFCWSTDKSMGVGYRSLFVAYCSARGSCKATSGRP